MENGPVLEFQNIEKLYPGVAALKNVNFTLRRGEVHALAGENGAGKSTLIKTCSGAIAPTSGSIIIEGERFGALSPVTARKHGIAVIYQELDLVNELPVYENIFLGRPIRKRIVVDRQAMRDRAAELFRLLDIYIDPNMLVKDLTVGYQQIVEIAKAISEETKILIMDEPSAALTNAEINAMMKIIAKLKASGVSIIYISHRLDEIFRISDRITILRDGQHIITMETKDATRDMLVKYMVGRELVETFPDRKTKSEEDIILAIKNVSGNGLEDVSFTLKRGEILGLGGLIGAGRTQLAQILFGTAGYQSGKITLYGKDYAPGNQAQAIQAGVALVPEDRKRQGVLMNLTIKDNISIPVLKKISKFSVINRKEEQRIVEEYKEMLKIKTPDINQLVKNLSGGNQQKVVLAKWLAATSELIIFDEPTRGIDVGAKQEIYALMDQLVRQGKTLIIISSEMEELMGMSDRIIVLAEGKVTGQLNREEFNQELILKYASMNE